MPIKNLNSKKFLAKNFKIASSSFDKALGLMFSRPNEALVMVFKKEHKIALHMFFVPVTIDVLFLNKKFEVVDMKQNFKPFSMYTSNKNAKCVIELQEGTIKESKTKIGHKISLFSVSIEDNKNSKRISVK